MAKIIIQDIIVRKSGPIEKKKTSLKFPSQIKKEANERKEVRAEKREEPGFSIDERRPIGKNANKFLWIVMVICLVALTFIISNTFSYATITVKQKTYPVDTKQAIQIKDGVSSVEYEILEIEKSASLKVEPDSKEYVERKAVGSVTIFNDFSTVSQRLVTNTRLETTDGLIYKIRQSVDLPGYKVKDGKRIPGSTSVEIIADIAGDAYNMKITDLKGDFKIAAFKNTSKYDKFYARLTSDISGGYIGEIKKLSEEKFTSIRDGLRASIKDALVEELSAKVVNDQIVIDDSYVIKFENSINQLTENNEIREAGKITAISFNKYDLAKLFNTQTPADTEVAKFAFSPDALFSAQISGDISKTADLISISFTGKGQNICTFNPEILTSKIAGVKKNALPSVISSEFLGCIESVQVSVRPDWNSKLPSNPEKISVRYSKE